MIDNVLNILRNPNNQFFNSIFLATLLFVSGLVQNFDAFTSCLLPFWILFSFIDLLDVGDTL